MNEQDVIKLQVRDWLMRQVPASAARSVSGLNVAICSDIGNVRTENQDKAAVLRAQVSPDKYFLVCVLCDGMGGMVEGESCAVLAVSSFISSCIRNRKLSVNERLLKGVNEANIDVFNEFGGDGGATLSALILDSDGNVAGINVGDSRIYSLSKGELQQISVDDTIAGQLQKGKQSSELSHKLLQFIGIGTDIEPHLLDFPVLSEIQSILLTSDGVHFIGDHTLKALASQKVPTLELSKRLVQISKWFGGHDNSTTIAITDVSNIPDNDQNTRTGTVQLWDSFGDVQFVGIEREQSPPPVKEPKLENNTDEPKEGNMPDSENQDVLSDGSTLKTRRSKKRADSKKRPKTKPQLRINFDE